MNEYRFIINFKKMGRIKKYFERNQLVVAHYIYVMSD